MAHRFTPWTLAATLAASAFAQAQQPPAAVDSPGATTSAATAPESQSIRRLQQAADELRASIQSLAGKPAGPERTTALDAAHQALLQTQSAMLALPPELRRAPSGAGTAGTDQEYDRSVRQLMAAADSLRGAVHAMAQEPAGMRRNDAIGQADQALLATQAAMANAYDLQLRGMGAGAAASGSSTSPGSSSQ